ncbi:MAG: hypothetical protein JXR77_05435 [Lentisphaeria bacterium]|nr:hypothetical protein [Lentisphaeria bacterium]
MRKVLLLAGAAVSWLVTAVCVVLLLRAGLDRRRAQARVGDLSARLETLTEQTEQQRARLETQLEDMVRGRLPEPLREILFDDVLRLDDGCLQSILFSRVGTAEKPAYEYKLVLQNDGPERISPRFLILVFDAVGVQIGEADVTESATWRSALGHGLDPGVSRSFSDVISLRFAGMPRYFLVVPAPTGGTSPIRLTP